MHCSSTGTLLLFPLYYVLALLLRFTSKTAEFVAADPSPFPFSTQIYSSSFFLISISLFVL